MLPSMCKWLFIPLLYNTLTCNDCSNSVQQNTLAIQAEIVRAHNAEDALAASVAPVMNRAQAAEQAIASSVQNEHNRPRR